MRNSIKARRSFLFRALCLDKLRLRCKKTIKLLKLHLETYHEKWFFYLIALIFVLMALFKTLAAYLTVLLLLTKIIRFFILLLLYDKFIVFF